MVLTSGGRPAVAATLLLFATGLMCAILIPTAIGVRSPIHMSLPTHTILEFICIQVSFSVFVVGWATHRHVRSADTILLSLTCFAAGWLDLAHTLSFTGMPAFVTPSGPDKAICFWLAGRLVSTFGFLTVSLRPTIDLRRAGPRNALTALAILITLLSYVVILAYPERLPRMFTDEGGLTPLKLVIEGASSVLMAVAGYFFFSRSRKEPNSGFGWMACAGFMFAMGGVYFMFYARFTDLNNLAGHVYKAIGYLLIYRGVYVECVSKPYREARAAERAATEANHSKTRFLANVSHELRTPLGVIRGFSDMLSDEQAIAGAASKWVRTIARNARQLHLLIDDLLDLAKVESEHIGFDVRQFSPGEAIGEVVASLRLLAVNKGIDLATSSTLSPGFTMRSDPLRFNQILMNVIGNAVKFTPVGRVTVEVSHSNSGVRVVIEDTGIGIDPDEARRLFQPFAQANDPLRRHFGGTGLGLALSKKLSVRLNGDLVLEHSELGRGSRFTLTLPDQAGDGTAEPVTAAPQRPAVERLEGVRILAAEDSEDNRELLDLYLKPTGARVTFANDGRAAVRAAHDGAFDVILMDIQMPEMDGFEATAELRAAGWQGPIVALTAHAHPPERERAMRIGFSDYLVKPIVREALIRTVASHCRA